MTVYIVTFPFPKQIHKLLKKTEEDYIIACDDAVFFLFNEEIDFDFAIGDFDSLDQSFDLSTLKNVKILPSEKDVTDLEAAILYSTELNPEKIIVLGGLGGSRIEHTYANINLLKTFDNLEIMNDESRLFTIKKGTHHVSHHGYVNLFSLEDSVVTLDGFKYPLNNYYLSHKEILGISNELNSINGSIKVISGKILVILSHYDNKKRLITP